MLAGSILLSPLDVETMQHSVKNWRKHEARGMTITSPEKIA